MSFTWPWLLVLLLLVPGVAALAWWLERRRAKYAVSFTTQQITNSSRKSTCSGLLFGVASVILLLSTKVG